MHSATQRTTLSGQILQSSPQGFAYLRTGTLEIVGQLVKQINWGEISGQADFGDADTLIIPGLIDCHVHLPQFDRIGVLGMPLLTWLENSIFPAEIRWNDLDTAQILCQQVAQQLLAMGTTGVCAFATSNAMATQKSLECFGNRGLRGVIGQMLMDINGPDELCHPAEALIDQSARLLDRFPPGKRLAAALAPRFALACSESLMQSVGQLAEQRQAVIQTHLAETTAECDWIETHHPGRSYTEVYQQCGLLTERSLFGHGIYLETADLDRLLKTASIITHCPTANVFLGSGRMRLAEYQAAGISIGLGSDIGAGYERSMVRVARSMIETGIHVELTESQGNKHAFRWDRVPTAAQAWHQITAGNADVLNWPDAGRIAAAAPADLVVIRPDVPWCESEKPLLLGPNSPVASQRPLSQLMFSWDDRWIQRTYCLGANCLDTSDLDTKQVPRKRPADC